MGPAVGEGKCSVGVVIEKELAKHGAHSTVRADCPHLEEFVIREQGSKDFFPHHGVGGDGTTTHSRELSVLGGLETFCSIGCNSVNVR